MATHQALNNKSAVVSYGFLAFIASFSLSPPDVIKFGYRNCRMYTFISDCYCKHKPLLWWFIRLQGCCYKQLAVLRKGSLVCLLLLLLSKAFRVRYSVYNY